MSKNEKLDIEDDDARRERLGKLFADFNESKNAESTTGLPNTSGSSRPFLMPESDVLARVRAFLPDFQASTDAIVAQAASDPDAVNLERVGKGEGAVKMDLGLGVYDAPGLKGREDEEGGGLGPVVDMPDKSGSSDEEVTSSEESSEESDSEEDIKEVATDTPEK